MLNDTFVRNRGWAKSMVGDGPGYFPRLAAIQRPGSFWIGCSDSRVSANMLAGLQPGEVLVHRNVAKLVHSDRRCRARRRDADHARGLGAPLERRVHGLIDGLSDGVLRDLGCSIAAAGVPRLTDRPLSLSCNGDPPFGSCPDRRGRRDGRGRAPGGWEHREGRPSMTNGSDGDGRGPWESDHA